VPGLDIINKSSATATYGKGATRNAKPFSAIVLHHTGAGTVENLIKYGQTTDRARGGSFGYHFYIDRDGTVYQGAPMDKRTNHVKDPRNLMRVGGGDISNSNAIGISLVATHGGKETPEQVAAATKLVQSLKQSYKIGEGRIVGHGELQKDREHSEGAAVLRAMRGGQPVLVEKRTVPAAVDPDKLPKVAGTIQPSELLKLPPEAFNKLKAGLAPFLQTELKSRMDKAVASLAAKGSQDIITPQELDDAAPLIGAKTVSEWKESLTENKMLFDVKTEMKSMTKRERELRFNDMVPTGNVEDLAGEERTRFNLWVKASQDIDTAIKKDPLGYVSRETESGRQAIRLIAGAPDGEKGTEVRERAYNTLINLQRGEGVADNDIAIVGPREVNTIVNAYKSNKTGPAREQFIKSLRSVYGAHTDRVWTELARNGLPTALQAMATANERGQDSLVQAFALQEAINEGAGKDADAHGALRKRAGIDKNFDRNITDTVAPFSEALTFSSNDLRVAYRNAVEMTALYYMTQGQSQSDAISQAYKDLIGDRAEVYRGAIIPAEENDTDLRVALRGAYQALLERDEGRIISNLKVDRSKDYITERNSYLSLLRSSAKFRTSNDGTGFFVLDNTGQRVMTSSDEGGIAPLFYTIEEMRNSVALTEKKTLERYRR
jgi:hypothetical protein